MQTDCGIYQIVDIRNGKRYIGSSINLRHRQSTHINSKHGGWLYSKNFSKYKNEGKHLYIPWEYFHFGVIEYFDDKTTRKQLTKHENKLIILMKKVMPDSIVNLKPIIGERGRRKKNG